MHPVLVEFGRFHLYSYGVLVALGGVLSCWFWHSHREQMGIRKEEDFWLLVNVILAGGFVGGRVMFLIQYTQPWSPEFWQTLISFSRGFSVLGAFFGVAAGLWWFSRRTGTSLILIDYVMVGAPLWHAFGRVGCFLAGCCYGRPTDLPWGVTLRNARGMVDEALLGQPLHPAQLYEASLDLALCGLLYYLLRGVEKKRFPAGTVAAAYFAGYGVVRFFLEFYRGDVIPMRMGLTMAQGISLIFVATGAAVYMFLSKRSQRGLCSRS